MKNKLKILFLFLLLTNVLQAQVSEYEYKAAFVERFTRFIEWPEILAENNPNSTFKIVVIGTNNFNSALNDLFAEIKIKNHVPELIFTDNINDLSEANLVFISSSEKKRLAKIIAKIEKKPILIISDSKGFCQRGTHINLYTEGDYIRYEINQTAIEKTGLKVSSLLFASAKIITTDE